MAGEPLQLAPAKHGKFKVPYRPIPDINVTSLVDVTLVLLIIFMVAAPIMQNAVPIAVPQAVTAQPSSPDGLEIVIQKDGKIKINNTLVTEEGFDVAFSQVYKAGSSEPVFLKADKDVAYAKVMVVIDALRRTGVAQLGLVAEPGQSTSGRRR